jgi:asparagine synthase (glutamine-hydrolysing)
MCGIAGILSLTGTPVPDLRRRLEVMNDLIAHRGPDDAGLWTHERGHVGFAHRRLSIIDLAHGHQPMIDEAGNVITYNGETYNYPEVRAELSGERFVTNCDTEVVLAAYRRWGAGSLDRLRGMYAYAIWDERRGELFVARDRFGIKPLVYTVVDGVLYFASEAKALMPFLPRIATDPEGLRDYLAFQFCLGGKTLFEGVRELQPGHRFTVKNGSVREERYWEVYYELDWDHTTRWFQEKVEELLHESVRLHLRSDVPVASYLSGGLDSSSVASVASLYAGGEPMKAFVGKFSEDPQFDESRYARALADARGLELHEVDIGVEDFLSSIEAVAYHMDYPAAGPGSFPQYMVSQAASRACKVILGGQGGDEVFGGYTRYLIAYFEQCIKAAIDGTMRNGNFVVTYESIIPNLAALGNYKPLLQHFWREGMFEDLDARYFRLIDRAPDLEGIVDFEGLGAYEPFESFQAIFNGANVGHESYFDKMTHFDFKTLLPALLQVEDRVSMAHGLESRVPLLDHRMVELAATIPADSKFRGGDLKHIFKETTRTLVPDVIAERKDKMGFPVPLTDWMAGSAREFFTDVFSSEAARGRPYVDSERVLAELGRETRFGRKVWGLLSLELWQRAFHDREDHFKRLLTQERTATTP